MPLMAIRYKYKYSKFLWFISNDGVVITDQGYPYLYSFLDNYSNFYTHPIVCPHIQAVNYIPVMQYNNTTLCGAALWVSENYRLIHWRGNSTRVNPVDPVKVKCTTGKSGVPPRNGSAGSSLRTTPVINPLYQLNKLL